MCPFWGWERKREGGKQRREAVTWDMSAAVLNIATGVMSSEASGPVCKQQFYKLYSALVGSNKKKRYYDLFVCLFPHLLASAHKNSSVKGPDWLKNTPKTCCFPFIFNNILCWWGQTRLSVTQRVLLVELEDLSPCRVTGTPSSGGIHKVRSPTAVIPYINTHGRPLVQSKCSLLLCNEQWREQFSLLF